MRLRNFIKNEDAMFWMKFLGIGIIMLIIWGVLWYLLTQIPTLGILLRMPMMIVGMIGGVFIVVAIVLLILRK